MGGADMSTRKIRCPYCNESYEKQDLITHIDRKHEDSIPEGWTATRVVFKMVNKKDHGVCVVCKKETEWNEKRGKYNRICNNPNCKHKLREIALKNHIRVYNKPTLLNDMEHQKDMLKHRHISGKYKFKDGGVIEYVGSYEKKFLEFMDSVLEVNSNEIQEPGPTFEYKYNGETHKWITDFLYIPYNLVIEIKDGGDNPNKRTMKEYREKELAKDKMITKAGTYNYLKLTNNQFDQLLYIFAELREQLIDDTDENKKAIIHINEDTILESDTNFLMKLGDDSPANKKLESMSESEISQSIRDMISFAKVIGGAWVLNSPTLISMYEIFILGPTVYTLKILFGLFDIPINHIGACVDYILSIGKKQKPNILPVNTSKIPKGMAMLCANTHLVNIVRENIVPPQLERIARNGNNFEKAVSTLLSPMFWLMNLKEQYDARDILLLNTEMDIPSYREHMSDFTNKGCMIESGKTDVVAVNDGVVIFTSSQSFHDNFKYKNYTSLIAAGGNTVVIMHSIGCYSVYCHLKTNSIKVHVGQRVKQGQVIAKIGTTGNSTIEHLHFEMAYDTSLSAFSVGRTVSNFNFKCIEGRIIWFWDYDQIDKWMEFKRRTDYEQRKNAHIPNLCLVK